MIRKAAVAGSFYPANAQDLRKLINTFLSRATVSSTRPRALVVPHAGYIYSGPVAAAAYKGLKSASPHPGRVVVLGPSHRVPLAGMGLSSARLWETPLGSVHLDQPFIDGLMKFPGVEFNDQAHAPEHSIEAQLPFLQEVLGDFLLVPIVVGNAQQGDVAALLQGIPDDRETLIVATTDLSHYLPYDQAREMDAKTCAAVEALQSRGIADRRACGAYILRGFLDWARDNRLRGRTLALKNSGDTAGNRDQVVGYGAWAFEAS